MLNAIYLVTFLYTIHYALLIYVGSTFLEKNTSTYSPELVYSLIALATLFLLTLAPSFLRRAGQYVATIVYVIAILVATITLSFLKLPAFILVSAFIILNATQTIFRYDLDIYVEKFSNNTTTGWTRGIFLTVINTAIALSPLAAGRILETRGFSTLYIIAAFLITATLACVITTFRRIPENRYHNAPLIYTIKRMWRNSDIWNIASANFFLQFFYAWMVIYAPLFLYDTMGLSWTDIGYIFTIMLTAFIIFELPAGWLADKKLGEKEMLVAGFAIMGFSTLAIPFVSTHSIWTWAFLFFCTRTGAALVEIMIETYFFKKVGADDTDIVSVFRLATPFSYFVAMPIAAAILYASHRNYLPIFIALGFLMFYAIRHAAAITDTK